jgi:hypothetical protein
MMGPRKRGCGKMGVRCKCGRIVSSDSIDADGVETSDSAIMKLDLTIQIQSENKLVLR